MSDFYKVELEEKIKEQARFSSLYTVVENWRQHSPGLAGHKVLQAFEMIFKVLWGETHCQRSLIQVPVVKGNALPLTDCLQFLPQLLDIQGTPSTSFS